MPPESSRWYLLKHDDATVFGPLDFQQLRAWATEAQVSPFDKVSNDNQTWIKAPMLPELEMDWLIEVTADRLYGPTTLGAVREFYVMGELADNTRILNATDGSSYRLGDLIESEEEEEEQTEGSTSSGSKKSGDGQPGSIDPGRAGIRVSLQQRIRELEEALLEERRAHDVLESQFKKLAETYEAKTGEPAPI